jgi:hypothetical protein
MAFSFIKISIACLIMTHFIEVLDGLSIPLLISISAAIYFILIFLFRVIDDVDIQMAKQLIGGLKAPGGEGGD